MKKSHVLTVARLQRESIQVGLTAYLGQRFCERLYWGLATTRYSFVLVYEEQGQVLGFVCGATDTRKMYRSLIARRFVSLTLAAFTRLMRPSVLRKAWISIRRPKRFTRGDFAEWNLPEAELISIALDPAAQGKRIGTQLVGALFRRLRKAGCDRVRVWTSEENDRAVKFYQKHGFQWLGMRPHHTVPIHILVCDIPDDAERNAGSSDLAGS